MVTRANGPVQHSPRGEFVCFDAHELELIERALRHFTSCYEHLDHHAAIDAVVLSGRVHVLNATFGGVGLHTQPLDAVVQRLVCS